MSTSLDLARAVLEKVRRDQRPPVISQATVLEVMAGDDYPIPMARVHIDGNPGDLVNTCPIAIADPLVPGQRVLVQFDPPAGAHVAGTVTASRATSRPYSTFIIAAVDSIAPGREAADYVCDGIDDDEQIGAAINRVVDGGVGGRVLLLEGTFDVSGWTLPVRSGVVVEGQGKQATRLYNDAPVVNVLYQGGGLCRLTVAAMNLDAIGYMIGDESDSWEHEVRWETQGGV